jgi:hypothetical protein
MNVKSASWNGSATHSHTRIDSATSAVRVGASPSGSALNTILAVREHAPTEIGELDAEIKQLHHRLAAAHARKQLLEELLAVIEEADARHERRDLRLET